MWAAILGSFLIGATIGLAVGVLSGAIIGQEMANDKVGRTIDNPPCAGKEGKVQR